MNRIRYFEALVSYEDSLNSLGYIMIIEYRPGMFQCYVEKDDILFYPHQIDFLFPGCIKLSNELALSNVIGWLAELAKGADPASVSHVW